MQPENIPSQPNPITERVANKIGWLAITRKKSRRRNGKQLASVQFKSYLEQTNHPEIDSYYAVASKIQLLTRQNKLADMLPEPVSHSSIFDTKYKNHKGKHDEQEHTTFFNLANPSQGRQSSNRNALARGDARDQSSLQLTSTSDAGYNSLFDFIESNKYLQNERARQIRALAQEASIASQTIAINDFLRNDPLANGIVDYANNFFAKHADKGDVKNLVGLEAKDQLGAMRLLIETSRVRLAQSERRFELYPKERTAELSARISEQKEIFHHSIAIYRKMHQIEKIAVAANKGDLWNDMFWGGTPWTRVVWDGSAMKVTDRGPLVGDQKVAPGRDTIQALKDIAKSMGIPATLITYETTQPDRYPNTLGQYDPWGGRETAGRFTIFPRLIDGTNNSMLQLRAVLNHEAAHNTYEMVSRAVRYSNDTEQASKTPIKATSAQAAWRSILQRDLARDLQQQRDDDIRSEVGLPIARKLGKPSFLGTTFQSKMLRALTNPFSIMKVATNGLVTGKKGYEQFVDLLKTDGVSEYSVKFWSDFKMLPSEKSLRLAINETLAEIAYAKAEGKGSMISKSWLKASETFETFFAKIGSPYLGEPKN